MFRAELRNFREEHVTNPNPNSVCSTVHLSVCTPVRPYVKPGDYVGIYSVAPNCSYLLIAHSYTPANEPLPCFAATPDASIYSRCLYLY